MAILICLIVFLCQVSLPCSFASEVYYARIMQDETFLYLSPIAVEDSSNVLFILPKTYFVQLLDEAGNDFFKVKYKQFYGYVKKDKVQTVATMPQTPFLDDLNFRVYAELSRDMRSNPTTKNESSSQLVYIPNLSRNLTYYGKIVGDQLIDGRTNIWYYCKYSADKDYYGYIYSDFCDELANPIPINSEEMEYTLAPDFAPKQPEQTSIPIENKTTSIVIAILSIPACLFVYLIMRSSKIATGKRTKQKEVIDY